MKNIDNSVSCGLAQRREAAARKIRRRGEMIRAHGQHGGLFYQKRGWKIDSSLGYMRDGNVSHCVAVGFRPKTNGWNRYGQARQFSRHDTRLEAALQE